MLNKGQHGSRLTRWPFKIKQQKIVKLVLLLSQVSFIQWSIDTVVGGCSFTWLGEVTMVCNQLPSFNKQSRMPTNMQKARVEVEGMIFTEQFTSLEGRCLIICLLWEVLENKTGTKKPTHTIQHISLELFQQVFMIAKTCSQSQSNRFRQFQWVQWVCGWEQRLEPDGYCAMEVYLRHVSLILQINKSNIPAWYRAHSFSCKDMKILELV